MSLAATIPAIAEDGSYYKIGKLAAHEQGVLHRAISVFVFDGEHLLLQRRAAGKYHCPGLWANTCCSHPHWEEPVERAAARRMREELGASLPLTRCATLVYRADVGGGLEEHERVTVFRGDVDRTGLALAPNADEVSEIAWPTLPELRAQCEQEPERFTPWLRIYLERWSELGL